MSDKNSKKRTKKTSSKNNNDTSIKPVKNKKNKKEKFSKRHPKISLALKIMLILIILLIIVISGILVGMVYCGWGDDFEITKEELVIAESNSVVLDTNGNVIAELSGDESRKIITLDQMSPYLPKAYVAIEDERFYEHNGVDIKRTGAAILSFVTHGGSSSFGGSTITQQLVKNITKDDQDEGFEGVTRKVKEWAKAYQIEKMLSKDQILELYLNIIFVGGKNAGVEVGAKYYFNKSASELDLAECAFLAGINKGPNGYNPYGENGYTVDEKKKEKINTRTKTVLDQMLKLGYITQEEHDAACQKVNDGLVFTKGTETGSVYSYHTDATIAKVIEDVATAKNISTSLATTYVYSSGLTIYSTQNTEVQSQLNTVMGTNASNYIQKSAKGKDENGNDITTQAAMAIIDNQTGYVVGVYGELGEKRASRGLNRATQSPRQTGSSIKPLTSLIPGINEGVITAATLYDDSATTFEGNWNPKNYNYFKGIISIRSAVTTSQNIPFAKVVSELTPSKSMEYLKKMGVTTLDDVKDNTLASMSIGGLTNGITPLEVAGCYATIANNGVYRTPLLYTKVTDSEGIVILEPKQESTQICSEQAAYVIKDILKSVVQSGTATYCKISGIDVAAKTGSTNNYYDRWLCGFTNYYTAATWYGYDENETVRGETNWAGKIWSEVMKKAHQGKESSRFDKPEGIVSATICKASGKKATDKCTDTYQEIFVEGTVPGDCDAHSNAAQICNDSGLLANEYCSNVSTQYFSYTIEKERLGLWQNKTATAKEAPTEYCTLHSVTNTTKVFAAPKITLNGDAKITLTVGEKYTEKGATAKDEIDGDITSKIETSGTVNTSKAGTYEITYKVKNSKGKETVVKRTITVKEKSSSSNGNKTNENSTNTTNNVAKPSGNTTNTNQVVNQNKNETNTTNTNTTKGKNNTN